MSSSIPPNRRALVTRGGWEGHAPKAATELFIPFLERNGFQVRVSASLDVYADADYLPTVDLIVQCWTMGTIGADELAGLRAAVAAGTGLAGWHGGIADSFRDSTDYLHLIGGQFAAHPGKPPGEQVPDDPANYFVEHRIEIAPAAADHPIVTGVGDFDVVSEQYWVLSDTYNDVLATTTQQVRPGDPWSRQVVSPAVWTREWGKGRVFVATPGHDVETLRLPAVRTIVERGMLWASR